jgi:hypothetical protein
MAAADAYRAICYSARAIPGQLGLRPHTVSVVTTTWSGAVTGEGTKTETVTVIAEAGGLPPKVRWLSDEEVAVGSLQGGAVEIGPITPLFSGGGTDTTLLKGASLGVGDEIRILITGPEHPNGALYRITSTDFGSALHYMIRATPITDA